MNWVLFGHYILKVRTYFGPLVTYTTLEIPTDPRRVLEPNFVNV